MRVMIGTAALIGAVIMAATSASAATERHYDCAKPGNANKAACKAAASGVPVAASTPTATTTAAAPPKAERHYDCTKLGNAKKAVCKSAAPTPAATLSPAAPAAPVRPTARTTAAAPAGPSSPAAGGSPRIVAYTEKNGKVVHYDCSKAGNFTKKACKS